MDCYWNYFFWPPPVWSVQLPLSVLLFISALDHAAVPRVSMRQVLWADMNWLSISLVTGGLAGSLGRTREADKLCSVLFLPQFFHPVKVRWVQENVSCSQAVAFYILSFFSHTTHAAVSKAHERAGNWTVIMVGVWMTHSFVLPGNRVSWQSYTHQLSCLVICERGSILCCPVFPCSFLALF